MVVRLPTTSVPVASVKITIISPAYALFVETVATRALHLRAKLAPEVTANGVEDSTMRWLDLVSTLTCIIDDQ